MNYMIVRENVTCDGPGLRTSVYFAGCQRVLDHQACPGCHNAVAWDKNAGHIWSDTEQYHVLQSLQPSYIAGLSILGGEPLSDFNLKGVIELTEKSKRTYPDKSIWLWTGYILDEVIKTSKKKKILKLLNYVDFVVDGPFVIEQKDPNLRFKGSANQRILKIDHTDKNKWIDVSNQF